MRRTQQAMGAANREAREFGRAMQIQARMRELQGMMNRGMGTDAVRAEYRRLQEQYARLSPTVRQLGGDIDALRRRQEQAGASAARLHSRAAAYQAIQEQSQQRAQLVGKAMAAAGTAMIAATPLKAAIGFESVMADVAKTVDGTRDEAGKLTDVYYGIEKSVFELGKTLPLTHEEIASLYAAAGQQGIKSAEGMREFTVMASHMAVAFGMSTEEAAQAIGGYQSALGLGMEDTRSLLDLMNEFANNSSTTEKDVAGVVRRVAALGEVGGVSATSITALGASLTAMKIPEEVAATSIKNFILALTKGDSATKSQKAVFAKLGIDSKKLAQQMQVDSDGAMLAVMKSIQKLDKAEQIGALNELFGSESLMGIGPMLTRLDLIQDNLKISGDKARYAGAMQKEFENRSKTTANSLVLFRNAVNSVAVGIGNSVLPAFNSVLARLTAFADGVGDFVRKNQGLVSAVTAVAGGFISLTGVSILAQIVFSYMRTGVAGVRLAMLGMSNIVATSTARMNALTLASIRARAAALLQAAGAKVAAGAQAFLNAVVRANPLVRFVAVVTVAGAALYTLYQTSNAARETMTAFWESIRPYVPVAMSVVGVLVAIKAATIALRVVWAGTTAAAGLLRVAWTGVMAAGRAFVAISRLMTLSSLRMHAAMLVQAAGTKIVAVAQGVLNAVMSASPMGILLRAIPLVAAAFTVLHHVCEPVREAFGRLFDYLAEKFAWFGKAADVVSGAWGGLKSVLGFGDDEQEAPAAGAEGATPAAAKKKEKGFFSGIGELFGFGGDDEDAAVAAPIAADAAVKTVQERTEKNAAQVAVETSAPPIDINAPAAADLAKPVMAEAAKAPAQKAAAPVQPRVAQEAARAAAPKAAPKAQPGAQKAAPATAPAAPQVNFTIQADLKGIPDQAFADGVVNAIKSRKSDLENILNEIVNNQVRLAYGGTAQS